MLCVVSVGLEMMLVSYLFVRSEELARNDQLLNLSCSLVDLKRAHDIMNDDSKA